MTTELPPRPPRRPLGLLLCQLAVPALAIPSALGVAKFFSIADSTPHWTAQGVIAAAGFELMNVGLSILDVRHPDLHPAVQRVRRWSVATAITLNVLAHYGARVPALDRVDLVGGLLALVAAVPLAVLYVALAGLLHALSADERRTADAHAQLDAALAQARAAALAAQAELHQARAQQAQAREAAREAQARLAAELATAREALARAEARGATDRDAQAAALREARAAAAQAARECQRLGAEAGALRDELAERGDRSRAALIRAAQALQATHGWGASEIGRQLGWPESTVRGWLPAQHAASAAD